MSGAALVQPHPLVPCRFPESWKIQRLFIPSAKAEMAFQFSLNGNISHSLSGNSHQPLPGCRGGCVGCPFAALLEHLSILALSKPSTHCVITLCSCPQLPDTLSPICSLPLGFYSKVSRIQGLKRNCKLDFRDLKTWQAQSHCFHLLIPTEMTILFFCVAISNEPICILYSLQVTPQNPRPQSFPFLTLPCLRKSHHRNNRLSRLWGAPSWGKARVRIGHRKCWKAS